MRHYVFAIAAVYLLPAADAQSAPSDTLFAPTPQQNYGFGFAAASAPLADGVFRVVVSEINHPTGGQFPLGVVHVFALDPESGAWSYEDLLVPPDGTAVFGGSVALADDEGGAFAIVGGGTVGTTVWRRDDASGMWNMEVVLRGFEPPGGGEALGSGADALLLLSGEEVALIGAENGGDSPNSDREGAAYAFVHAPGSSEWVRETRLLAPDAAPGEEFGAAVAVAPLSGGHPGDALALVGAPRRPFFTTQEGRALAFRRDGQTRIWTLETELSYPAGNPEVFDFGIDVALHPVPGGEPGELVALVGAPFGYTCGVVNTGVAFVYHRSSTGSWTHEETLCSQVRRQDNRFGSAIAMDAHPVVPLNGGAGVIRALVGTEPGPIPTEGHPGGADLFERTVDEPGTVTWTRHAHFQSGATGSANADWYGSAVALAGLFALVGARASNLAAPSAGVVFVYGPTIVANEPELPSEPWAGAVRVQPNPSLGRAEVVVDLEVPSSVRITVLDVLGRVVERLHEGELGSGRHRFAVEGLRSGVYLVRVEGRAGMPVSRFTVVR